MEYARVSCNVVREGKWGNAGSVGGRLRKGGQWEGREIPLKAGMQ